MLEKEVIKRLTEEKITISTAESCTGGLVAKYLTDVPGASKVFMGGVVSYTNSVKKGVLHVRKSTLEQYGAVSKETAVEMARGVQHLVGSDIGVSITGVAGPDKDEKGNEVGTVYIGLSTGKESVFTENSFLGTREDIREAAAERVFEMILSVLKQEEKNNGNEE